MFDEAIASGEAFGYNGPHETGYEADFCEMMGGGYADGVNSGTSALFCALGALDLPPCSEVVVPAISDPGAAMPAALLNCVPVVRCALPPPHPTRLARPTHTIPAQKACGGGAQRRGTWQLQHRA